MIFCKIVALEHATDVGSQQDDVAFGICRNQLFERDAVQSRTVLVCWLKSLVRRCRDILAHF